MLREYPKFGPQASLRKTNRKSKCGCDSYARQILWDIRLTRNFTHTISDSQKIAGDATQVDFCDVREVTQKCREMGTVQKWVAVLRLFAIAIRLS